MEKTSEKKSTKKKNSKSKLMVSIMLTAAMFLVEIYLMFAATEKITLIAGIGAVVLIAASFVVSSVLDFVDEKVDIQKELYDNIHKSEKASYVLLKKRLEALSKQVEILEQNLAKDNNSSAEIIKAQKSIAKIAMGKSKETQDRLFIELNNLEASLNERVRELSKRLSGFQEEIERLADHIAKINTEAIQEAARGGYERREAEEVRIESFPVEEASVEDERVEDALEEEFSVDDILNDVFEEEAPIPASTPAPAPVSAPAPVMMPADDGGKMDQDDIAALIASMTGGDETPIEEPEPTPLPLSGDPNKMMTPEEIAALLAGM